VITEETEIVAYVTEPVANCIWALQSAAQDSTESDEDARKMAWNTVMFILLAELRDDPDVADGVNEGLKRSDIGWRLFREN
jgi:hypothetical protein